MTIQALKRKKQELLASQVSRIASDTNENLLRVNLSKFFTDLEHEIQSALLEYWNDHMLLQGQVNLILASIHEKHQEYYELIMKHKLQEFHRAEQMGKRLVKRQQQSAMKATKPVKITANRDNLFGTLQYSEDKLRNMTFTASENTLNRVDSNINEILLDGYKSGVGINEVSRQITERFDQLRTWEAKRIARTEIHTAQNMGVMNSYESLGVEYTQWIAASDDRTRESHVEIDREIIPIGSTYSNGLAFPGDTSGPIEEWINCRCSNAPFVMPAGMMAPSFSPFREEDLIPIEVEPVQPTEPQPIEEPPINPRINELEKQIADTQALVDKWKSRGNNSLAKTFEAEVKQLTEELDELKNQKTKPDAPSKNISKEEIDNILADVLNDVGLSSKAPKTKSPEISKNIKTTHDSNLWENLAEKHNMELIEASEAYVKFHDAEYNTNIEFNINSNKEWIDYTNSGKKARNMEDFLKFYNEAPVNYKKASPPIKVIGSAPYAGVCELGAGTFHIKLGRTAYQKLELYKDGGNLQHTMLHEMSHAYDIRYAPSRTHARMGDEWWYSKQKGGVYRKAMTKDRRNRKKTNGNLWVSEYVRTTSNAKKVTEDWADLGGVVAFRDIADKSQAYLLEINSKGEPVKVGYHELKKRYPNRWKVLEEAIFGESISNW